jgi:hypothetical protein
MHAHDLELVRAPVSPKPAQGTATVTAHDGQGFGLNLGAETEPVTAQRAASCLLAPAVGDRVWFVAEGSRCHIIAVLDRAEPSAIATLGIEGDAHLQVGGKLTIDAQTGLELRSAAKLALTSDELRVRARLGRVLFDECSAVLRSLFTHVTTATFVAKLFESLTERFTQHSKTSYRSVEEVDQLQAGNIDYHAKSTAHIGATHALVKGGELVKVDGGQIHLG